MKNVDIGEYELRSVEGTDKKELQYWNFNGELSMFGTYLFANEGNHAGPMTFYSEKEKKYVRSRLH